MKLLKLTFLIALIAVISFALTGCGVSKNKYEALLNEKIALEEKLNLLTKSRDALRSEYENLLKDKMDLASKAETMANEKNALKGEYDKLLDDKVSLKAAYDKVAMPQKTSGAEDRKPFKK
jgi:cell division protein FtsB